MPEDILNNIRAFVRNQSASSLMQMMQNNHAIDKPLQEAEPILNIINMNNSTVHQSQNSNQTVSNTTQSFRPKHNTKSNCLTHNRRITEYTNMVLCKAVQSGGLFFKASRGNYTAYDCVYCNTQLLIFRFSFPHYT